MSKISNTFFQSPIGIIEIVGSDLGISSVKRVEAPKPASETLAESVKICKQQLEEYFDKRREHFDVKLDWSGHTEFYQSVWSTLLDIPFGRTTSYSAIADALDNPKAVRAIGMANRNNPIAIIVPCHRVIAKDGKLQGYFYGLDIKRQLLELENPNAFARQGQLF